MTAIIIENVSHGQLSIARFYGGIRINGLDYTYFPKHDILVQEKYRKKYQQLPYKKFLELIKNPSNEKEIKSNQVRKSTQRKSNPQMSKGLFETGDVSPF